MQTPLVFRAILGLLMDLAIPAALGAFVLAGMRLRSEGGMNFEAGGGFLKWLFWGCLLISLVPCIGLCRPRAAPAPRDCYTWCCS